MTPLPPLIQLKRVATSRLTMAHEVSLHLPNRLVASNLAATNPVFAEHMRTGVYRERTARIEAVELIEMPEGTRVYGGGHYVTAVGDALIEEQFPPYIGTFVPSLSDIVGVSRPVEVVENEVLLVSRFGVSTWGHWIGELLPKLLLAERACPGRFRYALPGHVIDAAQSRSIWSSIRESIMACGVDPSRILPLHDDRDYRFAKSWAVTPVWSDHMIHPAAGEILRQATSHIAPSGPSKLAVSRDARFKRQIANADAVQSLIERRGFESETTGGLRFVEQVARFKAVDQVFGVLGSDLTNLIFAKTGVGLISVAPDIFGDRFFYALVLDREGMMADMRGPVVTPEPIEHKGTFALDLDALESAFDKFAPR